MNRAIDRWRVWVAVVALTMTSRGEAATLVGGLGGPAGYGSQRLDPSDNGSSPPIDLTPVFPVGWLFFGVTYLSAYVNNNGNVTFDAPLATPTPSAFPVPGLHMLAAWWADVDTRGGTLADGTRDAVYWDVRPPTLTVTWHNVGYNDSHDDLQDDFQLIVTFYAVCNGAAAWEIQMRYHRCEWVSGDTSGGAGGHGGVGAEAGFDAGDSVHYYALPWSLTDSVANLCTTSNVGDPGVWTFRLRPSKSGACSGSGVPCDTGLLGACALGTEVCNNGDLRCIQNQPAGPERCDAIDNNCNGAVDEGPNLCAPGALCFNGVCVPTCHGAGPCPSGRVCLSGEACVEDACASVSCPPGQFCRSGACVDAWVDACAGVSCPIPSQCQQGECVVPCERVTCPSGQVCEQGHCQTPCRCRGCQDGYSCAVDGTCQPSDCLGLVCAPGRVCRTALLDEPGAVAQCVDPCAGAVCPAGEYCTGGGCVFGVDPHADAGVDAIDRDGPSVDDGSSARTDAAVDDASGASGSGGNCGCAVVGTRGRPIFGAASMIALLVAAVRRRRRATWNALRPKSRE